MRMRVQRRGLVPAVVVTVVGVLLLYLGSTWGWAALQASSSAASGVGTLPDVVEAPPPNVATTDDYGPVGSVSLVFAGTDVRDGLFGELDPAWLAVSSTRGDYRALSVDRLPEPSAGVVGVSPAGDLLAWVDGSEVVVYDTVHGGTRSISLPGVTAVGSFSPDGSRLLVHDGELAVLDLEEGSVAARFHADHLVMRRAVWRPDGTSVDFVAGGRLLSGRVADSEVSAQPTDIPAGAQLAWAPGGQRLASLQEDSGVRRLYVSQVAPDGRLLAARPVAVSQVSLERLLGFSGQDRVAVIAYALESGAVERVLDVPLDGGAPSDLMTLPGPGVNWVGTQTLAVATDTLVFGSTEFEERVWPWSYQSRLVMSILLGVFLLGLFVTRRPRT